MHFNIINDPWLDVLYTNHERKTIGLREAIRDAHLIRCVKTETSLYVTEASIRIFLIAFVSDMLNSTSKKRLEPDGELLDFYLHGRFDMDIFDSYVRMCEEEGTSFDVFDEERPLLQTELETAKKVFKKDNLKPVADLDPTVPTGNNSVFFTKKCRSEVPENDVSMTPGEYWIKLLTFQTALSPTGGSGYTPGRFVTFSPLYLFPEGKTLFDTLFLSFPAFNKETKKQLPIWRRAYAYDENLHEPGFLSDAIAPTYNIRYAEFDDCGNITKINKCKMGIKSGVTTGHGRESFSEYPFFLSKEEEGRKGTVCECFRIHSGMTSGFEIIEALLSEVKSSKEQISLSSYRYNLTSGDSFLKHAPDYTKHRTGRKYVGYGIKMNQAKPVAQVKIEFTLPENLADLQRAGAFSDYFREIERIKIKAFFASVYYHGSTREEYDEIKEKIKKNKAGKKEKKLAGDIEALRDSIVLRLYDTIWDKYPEEVESLNSLKEDGEYTLWLKSARGRIYRASREAYADVARKYRNRMIQWTRGYLEMGAGSMNYRKDEDKCLDQVKKIWGNMTSTLSKGDLLKLRDGAGKRYDSIPQMKLLVNVVKATWEDGVGKPFQDDHTFLYACLMAQDVIDIKSGNTRRNSGERIQFADYLCEKYMDNSTSKRKIETLLATEDIFSNINRSGLLTLLGRAGRKNSINMMTLCTELENWNSTRYIWAEKIGRYVSEKSRENNTQSDS